MVIAQPPDRAVSRADGARAASAVEGAGLMLRLVRSGAAGTLSELAAAMGVSRSTAHQRAELLRAAGLVASEQAAPGARGRPAAVTSFNHRAGVVLAGHVGLTGTRLAITDLRGDVLHERLIGTELQGGADAVSERIEHEFDAMLAAAGGGADLVGVGLGLPSSGELAAYARSIGFGELDWGRERFVQHLRARYGVPVFADLDVNLLALAERRGSWPDAEVLVCLKLGTMIDAAIVVNSLPIRGANGTAGEFGHLKVPGSATPCTCGGVGCLNVVASGSALVARLASGGLAVHDVADVIALARTGEPTAVAAVRAAGRQIGEALAAVVNVLNPSVVVAWGYLTEVEMPLFAGLREGLYQQALPGASRDLVIKSAVLGELAGVHGAAMLVLDEVLEPDAVDRVLVTRSWADAAPDGMMQSA